MENKDYNNLQKSKLDNYQLPDLEAKINVFANLIIDRKRIIQIEVQKLLGKDWCDYFLAGMTKKDLNELIKISSNKGVGE